MLLTLVKKDMLIAKQFVFVTMLVVIAIPLFIMWIAPSLSSGFIPFLFTVIIVELMLLQYISQEEAKYPKATALLCTAPYTRSTLVKAKYLFFVLIFAYCYIVNTLIMLVMDKSNFLDITSTLAVLLLSVLIYGIYMPIEVKYGNSKARFVFMIIIFALSFGPIVFAKLFANITIDFSALTAIPAIIKNIMLALTSIVIFAVSLLVSIKIFSRKEL